MLKRLIIYTFSILCLSCNSDIENINTILPNQEKELIKFNITLNEDISTKINTGVNFKSAWEVGDKIGIFAIKYEADEKQSLKEQNNFLHNIELIYSKDGTWITENEIYYPNDNSLIDIYAYYPYDSQATNPLKINISTKEDQNTNNNYSKSDFLIAKKGKIQKSKNSIDLSFDHILSMIQIEVPSPGRGFGPSDDMIVKCAQLNTDAVLNLDTEEIKNSNIKKDVTLFRVNENNNTYIYRAIVLPKQTIDESNKFEFSQFNNKHYYYPKNQFTTTTKVVKSYEISIPPTLHTSHIPPGDFWMGDKENTLNYIYYPTYHHVTLTKGFKITKYMITNIQYAYYINSIIHNINYDPSTKMGYHIDYPHKPIIMESPRGLKRNEDGSWTPQNGYEDYPIAYVSWQGAMLYAEWAGGTLPTEAQWEYACRAGTTAKWATASGTDSDLAEYAWYNGNPNYTGNNKPVGSLKPNNWGLYDMMGFYYEWCLDYGNYFSGTTPVTDPYVPDLTDPNDYPVAHMVRGGAGNSDICNSTFRNAFMGDKGIVFDVSFRIIFPE